VSVRLRVDLEYDGTRFAGWQVQPGRRTVQGEVSQAFSIILRHPVRLVGAGRTDAGVHARGQVAHVDVPSDCPPLDRLRVGVQALVGTDIAVRGIEYAPATFHARFSARARTYRYRMARRPCALNRAMVWVLRRDVDRAEMERALPYLVGRYPATSWCAAHAPDRDAVVEVRQARFVEEGCPGASDLLVFEITADRFVAQMVRTIVGTLVEVGQHKRTPESIGELVRARDRRLAGPTAPACGLCLEYVDYPDGSSVFSVGSA